MKLKIILLLLFSFLFLVFLYYNCNNKLLISNLIINKNKLDNIISSNQIINKIDVPIYYINLDRSENRKEFMEKQFRTFNIYDYKRISGVDAKKLKNISHDTIDNITFTNNYKTLKKNEVGCLLSHLKAIKTAYDSGLEQVLILEDDCSLNLMVFWEDKLTSLLNRFNKPDWEIFQLFTTNCLDLKSKSCSLQSGKKDCWGCVAYLINKKGMKKVIDYIKTSNNNEIILGKYFNNKLFPIKGQSDIFIYQIAKTYYLNIPLFFANNSDLISTIQTDKNPDTISFDAANKIIDYYIKNHDKKN